MFTLFSKATTVVAVALGIVFLATSIIGAIWNFSSVPYWDMWDGYLNFYVRLLNGDMSAWWAQHVDHRIIVSNILFFMDLRIFSGTLWFLILANYLLVFANWMTLRSIALLVLTGEKSSASRVFFSGITLTFLFSWIQRENLTQAFQNGMFAAALFPMLAFMLLYRATCEAGWKSTFYFAGSLAAGVVAAGTMINGLAALPVMVFLAITLGASKSRIGIILALSIVVNIFYFRGFAPSSFLSESMLAHILDVITFFLANVGGPVHYVFQGDLWASVIAGSIILLVLSLFTISCFFKKIENKAVYIVLAISLYLTLTCGGIAVSRVSSGIEAAFTSRYMTNVLVLWAATLLLLLYSTRNVSLHRIVATVFMLVIPIALLPIQCEALNKNSTVITDRMVAALALQMGIIDKEKIETIWPWMDSIVILAKTPIERHLSIFGNPLIRDAAQTLGTINQYHSDNKCIGDIESVDLIAGDARFNRLNLWLINKNKGIVPGAFYVLKMDRKVIGYGISGYPRVGLSEDGIPIDAGASAYVLSDSLDGDMIIKSLDNTCEVVVRLPDAHQISMESISDANFIKGVTRGLKPAILIKSTDENRKVIQKSKGLKFSDGTERRVIKVYDNRGQLMVYLDGNHLRGENVGYPNKITVIP